MDEVLGRAVEVFWAKGYEATSIQDLVEGMGIQRGSLYAAFKDKQTLFIAALDRYRDRVVRKLLDILANERSAKGAIQVFFDALVDHLVTGGSLRGCLITNSAIERGLSDPETAKKVRLCLKQIEDAFYQTLLRAQESGELDSKNDVRALARYLTCSMQGLLVVGKIRHDRRSLEDIVKVALHALD